MKTDRDKTTFLIQLVKERIILAYFRLEVWELGGMSWRTWLFSICTNKDGKKGLYHQFCLLGLMLGINQNNENKVIPTINFYF